MKRYAFYMLIMAVAAVTACQKQSVLEDPVSPEPEASQKTTYTYTVGASIDTQEVKSDYDADGKFSWSTGDAISVLFHNGDDNKFFTLTRVSGTGNTATFSGEISEGYTIGASNGTVEDKKILAFYPASSNHTYSVSGDPSFYTPAVNDLSDGKFSANIPMYDKLTAEGNFTFKLMTCAYKITVTGLDVSKIQADVHNDESYYLSGSTSMSSSNYLRYDGSSKDITYICDVDGDKNAVFYISCRYGGDKHFKPVITIKDYSTGFIIKKVTAANAVNIPDKKVKRLTISAPGTGSPFTTNKFGIDWGNVSVSGTGATSTGHDGITSVKLAADQSYVYVYLGVDDSKLLKGYDYTNYLKLFLGEASVSSTTSWMWGTAPKTFSDELGVGWLLKSGAADFTSSGEAIYNDSQAVRLNGVDYYEIKLNRSAKDYLKNTVAGTVHVGFLVYYKYYAWDGEQGEYYMYAPGGDSILATSLPAYVAP